ncbi:hypothetical protein KW789_00815 [Candidatus Saccharibacteria bacterium]|jgi:hypothetical protein|nr:hypothetical protein [Candidatus Saccharibacteria bacterium]
MRKFMLCLAAIASLAFTATAFAEDPLPPGWISSPPPASIAGPSTTPAPNPFGPQCQLGSISYRLLLKSKPYLMLQSDGQCANALQQWDLWQFAGKTRTGWALSGFSHRKVLLVPLNNFSGRLSVTLTIGQSDTSFSRSCSLRTVGLSGTKLCR